jgi:hypothetical protein
VQDVWAGAFELVAVVGGGAGFVRVGGIWGRVGKGVVGGGGVLGLGGEDFVGVYRRIGK